MAVEIKSKRGIVSKAPYELYMTFVDMRNFVQFLPEDKKQGVTADFDSIHAEVQGIPSAADLPNPGIELGCPALQVDSLPAEPPGKPMVWEGESNGSN